MQISEGDCVMKSSAAQRNRQKNLQIRTTRADNPYSQYLKKYSLIH